MGQCSGKRPSSRVGPVGNGTTAVQLVDNIGAVTAADADAHLSSRAQARASKVAELETELRQARDKLREAEAAVLFPIDASLEEQRKAFQDLLTARPHLRNVIAEQNARPVTASAEAQGRKLRSLEGQLQAAAEAHSKLKAKYARRLKRAQLKRQHERAELQARVLELEEKLGTAEAARADLELRLRRAQSAPITLTRRSRVKTEGGMSPVESDGSDAEGGKRGSDDSDDADDDEDPRARLVMSLSERIAEMDEELMTAHARIAELEGGGGAEEDLNG